MMRCGDEVGNRVFGEGNNISRAHGLGDHSARGKD